LKQRHGGLVIEIARHIDWLTYLMMLAAFTSAFLFMTYIFVAPFFRQPFDSKTLVLLTPIAFIVTWYVIALRVGIWRAFGVERIVLENGLQHWTRTALFWKRNLDTPVKDITAVNPVTPWHGLSNHVEFITHGKRQKIGDMLSHSETWELACELRHHMNIPE
jgi:hypothetical protein